MDPGSLGAGKAMAKARSRSGAKGPKAVVAAR
jgi:hypothetical protein